MPLAVITGASGLLLAQWVTRRDLIGFTLHARGGTLEFRADTAVAERNLSRLRDALRGCIDGTDKLEARTRALADSIERLPTPAIRPVRPVRPVHPVRPPSP